MNPNVTKYNILQIYHTIMTSRYETTINTHACKNHKYEGSHSHINKYDGQNKQTYIHNYIQYIH